jgi:TolB-like protein/DNA-binding winged helix-turn-helix (wHTH) protein
MTRAGPRLRQALRRVVAPCQRALPACRPRVRGGWDTAAMGSLPCAGVLRFGELALDLATGELHRAARAPIALGARPTRLLALLACRHGQLVTRDEIQREVWSDGTTVGFDQSINQHVRQLRQILGDDAARPAWIQTLPGRGYRFLVASELVPDAAAATPPPLGPDAAPAAPRVEVERPDAPRVEVEPPEASRADELAPRAAAPAASHRPRRIGSARRIGLVLMVLLLATSGSGSMTSTTRSPIATPDAAVRLAVLVLDGDEPAERERALAVTDELIGALGEAYAPRLEVIALRSVMRYRGGAAPLAAIARELRVDHVVEGRVRNHAERTRISLRLVRARDSAQLWARTVEPSSQDGWAVEAAIAQDVAAALGHVLLPARTRPDAVLDVEAQHDYHRARHLLRRGDARGAARVLAEVAARAPRAARVWAALARAELRAGGSRSTAAVAAARAALEIDPAHPEAHFVRAVVAFYGEWDIEGARRHFEAAIAANPAFAEAHHQRATCYSAAGRHDEAVAAMQRAHALDPLAPEVVSDVGWYYYFARRYGDAAAWCRRTLALDPTFYWAHRCIVMAHQRRGDLPAAAAAAIEDLRARGAPAAVVTAVASRGLAAYWQWELDRRTSQAGATGFADRAVSRLALGDRAGALDDLERAVSSREGWLLPFLAVDPTFDDLRGEPRFAAVLRAVAAGAALP